MNKKNLLLITSHRQMEELDLLGKFLHRTSVIKNFDLILHVNKSDVDLGYIQRCFANYPNVHKHLIFTTQNAGYALGTHETIANLYHHFSKYDNVVHMHPDVFILDENKLLNVINNDTEYALLLSQCNLPDLQMLSTDMFIIRPKLLPFNIFANFVLPEYQKVWCETFLEMEIKKHNVSYKFIKRYDNDNWQPRRPCLWGGWHEHNLHPIRAFLG